MNLIESLMKTGLTKNESELYIALCREGELTGYEAAKLTGIPRANAYQALANLVDKGGAYTIEGSVQHFMAVPAEEYCLNVIIGINEVTEIIKHECPEARNPSEPYITIKGFKHITDKVRNIISSAKDRVYISVSEEDISYLKGLSFLKEELEKAVARGLKVVAIVTGNLSIEGAIVYTISKQSGRIRLISDSSNVLTGNITGSEDDFCLFSKNRLLVDLIKDSLKNEIRLSELDVNKPFAIDKKS